MSVHVCIYLPVLENEVVFEYGLLYPPFPLAGREPDTHESSVHVDLLLRQKRDVSYFVLFVH